MTSPSLIAHAVTPELVRGAIELEPTPLGLQPHRLPAWARAQNTDPQLAMVEAQPAGVRLAFRTRATRLEIETVPTKRVYAGMPPRPDGTYDLVADWWGVETTNGTSEAEFKDLVNQKYQYHNVKMACEEKGYSFEEEVNEEDGSIRLVVRKWVAE